MDTAVKMQFRGSSIEYSMVNRILTLDDGGKGNSVAVEAEIRVDVIKPGTDVFGDDLSMFKLCKASSKRR